MSNVCISFKNKIQTKKKVIVYLPDMGARLALKMGNGRRHFQSGLVMYAQIFQLIICSRTTPYGMFRSFLIVCDVIEKVIKVLVSEDSFVSACECRCVGESLLFVFCFPVTSVTLSMYQKKTVHDTNWN